MHVKLLIFKKDWNFNFSFCLAKTAKLTEHSN